MRLAACAAAAWCASAALASAQLPSRPVTALDGRLVVGATLSVSIAPSDDRAYYNLTSYDTNVLRMVQLTLDASFRVNDRLDLVAAGTGQTAVDRWGPDAYPSALYLAARVLPRSSLTVRAGIVPPAFGAFARRTYGTGNLLIGYPLAYQYATTVRADAFPRSADELLRRRGFGAVVGYSVGDAYRASGLPLVNPFGWNAGVGASAGSGRVHVDAALTRGGIAARLTRSGNGGWEATSRVEVRTGPSLTFGASGAYGAYVAGDQRELLDTASFNPAPREAALGFDFEYSRGYWLVRGEAIVNRRTVPVFARPYLADPLWTDWAAIEGRYKLFPGMYLAARAERLSFSRVAGTTLTDTWDANVRRIEAGGGYSLARNITAKLTYQRNWRDSRWYPRQQLVSAQVLLWF